MEQHPTKDELYAIYVAHHPTVQELETYKAYRNYESDLDVTELKLEATKAVPTVLEETMSVAQLFESGNPLWVHPYSVSELSFIIPMAQSLGDEVFTRLLRQASDYKTLSNALIAAS